MGAIIGALGAFHIRIRSIPAMRQGQKRYQEATEAIQSRLIKSGRLVRIILIIQAKIIGVRMRQDVNVK